MDVCVAVAAAETDIGTGVVVVVVVVVVVEEEEDDVGGEEEDEEDVIRRRGVGFTESLRTRANSDRSRPSILFFCFWVCGFL